MNNNPKKHTTMKKLFLLGLVTLITIYASAQIEIYNGQPNSNQKQLSATDVKNEYLKLMSKHTPAVISSLVDIYPAPNLIGDTLFSISEKLYETEIVNCVLMLNATEDTLRIKSLPVGEKFYVKDIIPFEFLEVLSSKFNGLVFVSDTFYNESYKKGRYIIPRTITPFESYEKLSIWEYLFRENDTYQNICSILSPPQTKLPVFGSPIYVLENSGNTYYVRYSARSKSRSDRLKSAFYPKYALSPNQTLHSLPTALPIYSAHLSSFISVSSYNFLKEKYAGKECYCIGAINKEDIKRDVLNGVYKFEKVIVKDGEICGEVISVESNKKYYWELEIIRQRMIKDGAIVVDSIMDLNCLCLKSDVDSLLTKWKYEEAQERLADERKQEQYRINMIQKYGENYGNLIAKGEICIGMTKDMCKEALGRPEQTNKVTNTLGVAEVWTYISNWAESVFLDIEDEEYMFVTFIDGKITSITE